MKKVLISAATIVAAVVLAVTLGGLVPDGLGPPVQAQQPTPTPTATPKPVGGIAELAEVAGTPLETGGSSGPNTGVLAGVIVGATAGAVALGGAAWYARRRWPR